MKILQINNLCGRGSTGKIVVGISELMAKNGIDNRIFYFVRRSDYPSSIKLTNKFYIKLQAFKSRFFGNYGFNSYLLTRKIIKRIKDYNPDIIHVHNIHGHNLNFETFFRFLKQKRVKVIYTFHDCWAFTGYCPYFTMSKCEKWLTSCDKCPSKKAYSWFLDKSKQNIEKKKDSLSGLDLMIITPSEWLAGLVRQSFLKNYPVKVINNGIDLNVFRPIRSDFRQRQGIKDDSFILLGTAFDWGARKGLDVFIELSKRLPDNYQIVLVGTNAYVDKLLPRNVISIRRTQNQMELAEIYTAADLFVNPTREENYPTVNMESLACGTPVLTFNTGGSPEIIDETCGSVVDCNDIDALIKEIKRICETKPYSEEACLKRSASFDMLERFQDYINLYHDLAD